MIIDQYEVSDSNEDSNNKIKIKIHKLIEDCIKKMVPDDS